MHTRMFHVGEDLGQNIIKKPLCNLHDRSHHKWIQTRLNFKQ